MAHHGHNHNSLKGLLIMAFGAIGVVYGDIGTSPLYAINEIFFGHAHIAHTQANEIGIISVVFWVLTLVVSIKYVIFVLRADNSGQGGVFALYEQLKRIKGRHAKFMTGVLVLAAGLLLGDGIITPAISVLSAVEGIKVATDSLEPLIIPITIVILTGLFLIQSKGTNVVGRFFGPIITVWFIALAGFGILNILKAPAILLALNPYFALDFIRHTDPMHLFVILGSVMLTITGGEALYADMGHFGARPIRVSWYFVAYPALVLQYLGQGAYMLSNSPVLYNNIFYSMIPAVLLVPMVVLATMATVIASQALITGAFSLVSQGIAIGLIPYTEIEHTHEDHEGQVYLPVVNYALYVGCILLVLWFRSSSNLASAYGLAVSADMLITSICMILIAAYIWKWNKLKIILTFGIFATIDSLFLASNSLKFIQGGYVPLTIGLVMFITMTTWKWGKDISYKAYHLMRTPRVNEFVKQLENPLNHFDSPIIMLSRNRVMKKTDRIPMVLNIFWDKYKAAPKHLLILSIRTKGRPYIKGDRFDIYEFDASSYGGKFTSVVANYGYMEDQTVGAVLDELFAKEKIQNGIPQKDWILQIGQDRLIMSDKMKFFRRARFVFYQFLKNIAVPSYHHMGLKKNTKLFIEVFPLPIE